MRPGLRVSSKATAHYNRLLQRGGAAGAAEAAGAGMLSIVSPQDGTNVTHLSQFLVRPGELKECLDPSTGMSVALGGGANAQVTKAVLSGDRWVHGGVSYARGKA